MLNRWSFFSYVATLIILTPIAFVINHALGSDTQTLTHLKETLLFDYILDTLIVVFGVGFLALIFGVWSAYITTIYDFRFVGFYTFALALPFMIPTYIMGYIYSDIFGYFNFVHLFLRSIGVTAYFNILNINALIVIMSLALYPYAYLIVKASFLKNKSALLNPALSLGASYKKIFYEIILPLSRPAIVGSLALIMMESISEYGITEYYNVQTLTIAVFNTWFGLHDSKSASYLALIAMMIVLIILSIEKFSRGRTSYEVQDSNEEVKKERLTGSKLLVTYIFISLPIIFGFVIPLAWIVVYAYEYASSMLTQEFLGILTNSFISATLSAFLILLLSLFIAYTARIFLLFY